MTRGFESAGTGTKVLAVIGGLYVVVTIIYVVVGGVLVATGAAATAVGNGQRQL